MEPWLRNLLVLATFFYECRGEDSVTQPPGDVITTEGGQVTLDCQFETSVSTSLNLFWYKYEANDFPRFMLGRSSFGSKNGTDFEDRFDAHLDTDSKSVPLTIQRVQLSDSAVYYCALKPTVTTGYTAPLQNHTELHNDNTPFISSISTNDYPEYVLWKDVIGPGDSDDRLKWRFDAHLNSIINQST
ncbi:unnamed protein product [Coregonus sp. 'balchen']|nr:unnamed protein product [Coregonus sp. 'balchen']